MVTINNKKIADIGFYINLDKRTDRNAHILDQFHKYNIQGIERHVGNTSSDSGVQNCKRSHFEVFAKFLNTSNETLLVLEDDCLFLPPFYEKAEEIFSDIYSIEWDMFWLGCKNRRRPKFYKNNCYRVSSVSHAQAYIITRKLCEKILKDYPADKFSNLIVDELMCLLIYGNEVVYDPHKFDFYKLDEPLEVLPTAYTSLCYERPLTTQYASYSDLWHMNTDYNRYITTGYPVDRETT